MFRGPVSASLRLARNLQAVEEDGRRSVSVIIVERVQQVCRSEHALSCFSYSAVASFKTTCNLASRVEFLFRRTAMESVRSLLSLEP